jgi:hypothetical protein
MERGQRSPLMEVGGDRDVRGFLSCHSTTSNVESAPMVRAAPTARSRLIRQVGQKKEAATNSMFFLEELGKCLGTHAGNAVLQ